MVTFFSIFFVFTSAYGVASYALLKSRQLALDFSIFRKIFHQAYWQNLLLFSWKYVFFAFYTHVFGQINDLDDIKGTKKKLFRQKMIFFFFR